MLSLGARIQPHNFLPPAKPRNIQMKIMSVVGARPNFMKVAPLIMAIREHNGSNAPETIQHILVHTGQHYDQLMSEAFFTDLNLPRPDVHLGIGSGSHAKQTAEAMREFEAVLLTEKPDVLVVVGDVNSTLAAALVAAKISFDNAGKRPIIAHVEAGLRSFDRDMPEEVNRILTDHISDLLFVTEESGLRNLANEGISSAKIHLVGNTMIDSLLAWKKKAEASTILEELGLRRTVNDSRFGPRVEPYALLTLHRPANVDNREVFRNILEGIEDLSRDCAVVFPAHPRTRKRIQEFGIGGYFAGDPGTYEAATPGVIRMIDPQGYLNFLCLMKHARVVVTDSGGIQEETTCLRVPCVTIRENTERPVTLKYGTNVLAGLQAAGIRAAIQKQMTRVFDNEAPQYWDGRASPRILEVLLSNCERKSQCASY